MSFKAENMERWVLDVKKVHSVKHPDNKTMRRLAYSFVSNLNFEELIEILKRENQL